MVFYLFESIHFFHDDSRMFSHGIYQLKQRPPPPGGFARRGAPGGAPQEAAWADVCKTRYIK